MSVGALPRPFGPFVLLRLLAEGGMGQVYLARVSSNAGIERICVVKTLKTMHAEDGEYARRFLDEARLVVQLSHRNICGVQQVGHVDDVLFIAMEHILGRDVNAVLHRCFEHKRPLAPELALAMVREVLEALDYAHRLAHAETGAPLRLVHRDLTPKNVMISFEGEVKLIDFGLAASTMKTEWTAAGQVFGKLAYLSPEQATGSPVDGRTDQYAAAVLAYEAITSARFYEGIKPSDVWSLIGQPYVPARWDLLAPGIAAILRRALSPQAALRYPTCGVMQREIERYMLDEKMIAGPAELRALMHELFPDAPATFRELLSRASTPPPHDVMSDTTVVLISAFDRTPISDSDSAPPLDPVGPAGDRTEVMRVRSAPAREHETYRIHRPAAQRRRWPLAAAAFASLVTAGVVGTVRALSPGDRSTVEVHAAFTGEPRAGPVAVPEAIALLPPVREPLEPVKALVQEPVATLKPSPAYDRPKLRPRGPPVASMSLTEKVSALNACGARKTCAGALLLRHRQGLAGKSVDEIRVFKAEVDRCVAQCRR